MILRPTTPAWANSRTAPFSNRLKHNRGVNAVFIVPTHLATSSALLTSARFSRGNRALGLRPTLAIRKLPQDSVKSCCTLFDRRNARSGLLRHPRAPEQSRAPLVTPERMGRREDHSNPGRGVGDSILPWDFLPLARETSGAETSAEGDRRALYSPSTWRKKADA